MPAYLRKNKSDILREVLRKAQQNTSITATSPGSVFRALAESITSELGDIYDIMDFNINQNIITTATGSALDMLGSLYGTDRKSLNSLATIDKQLGSFQFYLSNTFGTDIVIPKGTQVYTDATSYTGQRYSYATTADAVIPAGRTRAFAGLTPNFTDSIGTVGPGKLVLNSFTSPPGVTVLCTNLKAIQAQVGFEDDETYRTRIIKSIRVKSAGTLDAVRFAGLNVNGVRDIKIRQAPYGMGTFEAIIIPDQNGNTLQIVTMASAAMDAVRPMGVRMFVKQPVNIPLEMSVDLVVLGSGVTGIDAVAQRAKNGILRYINNLLPGSNIVYNGLIQAMFDSSELIKDVIIKKYSVNGTEIMRRNYQPDDDQQIIPGNITVRIAPNA